jgi:hypothetical protein
LSIYAEVEERYKKLKKFPDDFNGYEIILNTLVEYERKLWRAECLFREELLPQNYQRPDFEQFCEREIMKHFVKEEAARSTATA